jgi:hypothetical protein
VGVGHKTRLERPSREYVPMDAIRERYVAWHTNVATKYAAAFSKHPRTDAARGHGIRLNDGTAHDEHRERQERWLPRSPSEEVRIRPAVSRRSAKGQPDVSKRFELKGVPTCQ